MLIHLSLVIDLLILFMRYICGTLFVLMFSACSSSVVEAERDVINSHTHSTVGCKSVDGFYSYYPAGGVNNAMANGIGFNDVIRRAGVYGNIAGISIGLRDGNQNIAVSVVGDKLTSGLAASMLEKVVNYNLPVVCEDGLWVYKTNISGSSDGSSVKSINIFSIDIDVEGALIVNHFSKGYARLGGIVPQNWRGSSSYIFKRLR